MLRFLCSTTLIHDSLYMTTGKTIALTRQTFVGKVTSLLFNMLSRLVITFLPRSKRLLISWPQSPSAVILEPRKIVCHCFHCFLIYFPWSDGTRCHDLSFLKWVWSQLFHSPLSLSSRGSLVLWKLVAGNECRFWTLKPVSITLLWLL